jgi:hypothetical protein
MDRQYTGKCLCGDIQYTCTAEPAFSGNCHCKDCQRSSGGPFIPAMLFPVSAVEISGTPKYFKSTADSGKVIERGFCRECGSQLFTRLEALPEMLGVKAGTLDDASRFRPQLNFYVASAQPWDHMDAGLPKMPGPPRV